jgi:hypothetical protein
MGFWGFGRQYINGFWMDFVQFSIAPKTPKPLIWLLMIVRTIIFIKDENQIYDLFTADSCICRRPPKINANGLTQTETFMTYLHWQDQKSKEKKF